MTIEKIIRHSVKNIELRYKNISPNIFSTFYYGNYKQNPKSLSIIYIFDENVDLDYAKSKKLTDEIKRETFRELINNGYPKYAFESNFDFEFSNDKVNESDSEWFESVINKVNNQNVSVSFISNEDIKNKADGNIFLYLT